jgi:hypothetical protein
MRLPSGRIRVGRYAGLLLVLAAGACADAAPPERSTADVDSGHFDVALARMYLDGDGVPRDDAKAFYLLSNGSIVGDVDAKEMLGRLYADGRGTRRDDDLAITLFRAAADGGNVTALTDLGGMLEAGRGTPADAQSALDLYQRGMAAGDPAARENYQRLKKSLDTPPPKNPASPATPQVTAKPLSPPT